MSAQTIRNRFNRLDPVAVDVAMAIALAVLVCLQIWFITSGRPEFPVPPNARMMNSPRDLDFGPFPYLLATCAFLPLALRRSIPSMALLLSGVAVVLYEFLPFPPAFVVLGPMIALYSLAAFSRSRHMGLIALFVAGLVIAVPAFTLSSSVRWVADTVGTFTLLAAAALLGDTARNRREYIAEVEKRAAEAERTREEEALRRVEEERMRIARDVHDIVAHSLSIVTVQAGAAEAVLDSDPAQARESIRSIRTTGRDALNELRSMLNVLRTGESESPLAPASDLTNLEQLVAPVRESGLAVDLVVDGDVGAVPAYASVSAYRIVQEALTNIVRHAGAHRAKVAVRVSGNIIHLEVEDDGRGTTPQAMASGGHGLRGMRERVEALGGAFSLGLREPQGFRVSATIPLTRSSS